MDYYRLSDILAEHFPELTAEIEYYRYSDDGQEEGPHLVFGGVLAPAMERWMKADPPSQLQIGKALELLEKMERSGVAQIQEVSSFSVLERLVGEFEFPTIFWEMVGPETMKSIEYLHEFWGIEKPTQLGHVRHTDD